MTYSCRVLFAKINPSNHTSVSTYLMLIHMQKGIVFTEKKKGWVLSMNMEYEIVTLEEKIAVGVSARTNNTSLEMGTVIGGLWNRFYNDGVYASIPKKTNAKALGIYTDYAGDEKADYTAFVGCETAEAPAENEYAVCRIPAGQYAKFVVRGNMVQAVAEAWQEIWQMNLPRAFQCDFEEYQDDDMGDNAEIHIYVGLRE